MGAQVEPREAPAVDLRSVVAAFELSPAATLTERIYAALRHAILIGDLQPSTRLPEKLLTSILPVSRTPLREAVRRLEAEELVSSHPNRGVVVRGINLRDLLEVYETLEVLESYAVEVAAANMTPATLERLQTELELAEFHAGRHRWDDTTQHSVAFHSVIYQSTGNRRLWKLIGDLREMTHSFRRFRLRTDAELGRGLAQHRTVLEALERGNGAEAAAAMRDHVSRSTQLVREAIREQGNDELPFQPRVWLA